MLINEIDFKTDDQREEAEMVLRKLRRILIKSPTSVPSWFKLIQENYGMPYVVWPVQNPLIKTATPFLKNLTVIDPPMLALNGYLRHSLKADSYIKMHTDVKGIEGKENFYNLDVRRYITNAIKHSDPIFYNVVSSDIEVGLTSIHSGKQYWQLRAEKIQAILQPDVAKYSDMLCSIINGGLIKEFKQVISP